MCFSFFTQPKALYVNDEFMSVMYGKTKTRVSLQVQGAFQAKRPPLRRES